MAHMNSDVLLPAVIGYVATMLDNPNNVVEESSPPSSNMEIEAIDDLLEMVGFQARGNRTAGSVCGWGHFTSGGTIANFEALWVARNMKYFALALRDVASLNANIELTLPSGRRRLLHQQIPSGDKERTRQDDWELLNLTYTETLSLRHKLIDALAPVGSTDEDRESAAQRIDEGFFDRYSISATGLWDKSASRHPGVIFAGGNRHYSPGKAVEVLGMGRNQLITVSLDTEFRMDSAALRERLIECVDRHLPVIAVIATVGTTEEAAIDPVHKICDLRDEIAATKGLWFPVHVDAAYGGYIRTLFRGVDGKALNRHQVMDRIGYNWPSEVVHRAQQALNRAESVTIDPHKKGYVPYPCGAILFADERVRDTISSRAPYLWHGSRDAEKDDFLGPYTMEGTRAGAASAAAWLAQKVLPLHAEAHGRLIAGSVRNAQELYRTLTEMNPVHVGEHRVQILPIGQPDFSIVCFALNIENNVELNEMNKLTNQVYERFKPYKKPRDKYYGLEDYFVSKTEFDFDNYGVSLHPLLFEQAKIRVGDYNEENKGKVAVIRMAIMHPWSLVRTDGAEFDFIGSFCAALRAFLEGYVPDLVAERK